MITGDDYNKSWDYRVISQLDTEPAENAGRRHLEIRMVWYSAPPVAHPLPEDIFAIVAPVTVAGLPSNKGGGLPRRPCQS